VTTISECNERNRLLFIIFVLQLTDGGRLAVRWESGEFELAQVAEPAMDDGKWHWTELKWMNDELWLNVDYGHYEKTVAIESKLQGLVVAKVSIGGVQDLTDAPVGLQGLVGCVKDVRIGGERHQWMRSAIQHRVGDGCSAADSCISSVSSLRSGSSNTVDVCPLHGVCTDTWNDHTCTCEPGTNCPQ